MTTDPFRRLVERLAPGAALVSRAPLTGGVSAHVHALALAHPDGRVERLVVRRHGALAKGHRAEVAAHEFRLLEQLHAAGLPVAEPRSLDADGEIFGTPCLVLGFVEGSTDLPPDGPERMAELLARIHALDVASLGVTFLPRRADPADEGAEGLPPRRTPLRRPSLLHGDFWPGNLLWRDGRIVAVLDWEDAAVGDPLSDVAGCRQELLWKRGEEGMEAFTRAYAALAPVDRRELAIWEVFVATAALAHMGRWGLDPAVEVGMRERSRVFLARAEGEAGS